MSCCDFQVTNMRMVLSQEDHPPIFNMLETKVVLVSSDNNIEVLTNQDMIDKEMKFRTSKGFHPTIGRDMFKAMEGTIGRHKIIHLNKIMVTSHQ